MTKLDKGALAGISSLALALCCGSAMAQNAGGPAPGSLADVAARFGARPLIRNISLSPDGRRIALVANAPDGTEVVATADLEAGQPPTSIMRSPGKDSHISHCFWPTDQRLVCTATLIEQGRELMGFSRQLSLNPDGSDLKLLTVKNTARSIFASQYGGGVIDQTGGDPPGSVLMMRAFVPENTVGTHLASQAEGLGVERVDVTTLARKTVEAPREETIGYVTDGWGEVRLRADTDHTNQGYTQNYTDWFYRKPGSRDWLPLNRVTLTAEGQEVGFDPVAVDPKLNVAYGFDVKDGLRSLYRVKLDGSNARELALSQSSVDVDGLLEIGRHHRVVGASYATDRREVEFFDPELNQIAGAIGRGLPGSPQIGFVDSSEDESKLLVLATSDINPGVFYRYDKKTRQLVEVSPVRPELAKTALAPMKAVTFTARDGTQVPAYLTLPVGGPGKGLPAIVLPHGGPSARDELGFDWLVQFFAARGFAVIQPNFRGSAGYGAEWFQKNGFQSWRSAISDVDDAGKWLVSQGIADQNKLAIVGWSYGGYAALQSGVFEPGLFKAIVAIAPVTDLYDLVNSKIHFADYNNLREMIGTGPQLKEGSPAQNTKQFVAPVLLFHGTLDQNTPVQQSRTMRDRLKAASKPVDYVEFNGLDHQLDDANARTAMLTRTDGFLRQALGMPGQP